MDSLQRWVQIILRDFRLKYRDRWKSMRRGIKRNFELYKEKCNDNAGKGKNGSRERGDNNLRELVVESQ